MSAISSSELLTKEGRKTAEEWEKVFSQHDKEITNRYESFVTTGRQGEA